MSLGYPLVCLILDHLPRHLLAPLLFVTFDGESFDLWLEFEIMHGGLSPILLLSSSYELLLMSLLIRIREEVVLLYYVLVWHVHFGVIALEKLRLTHSLRRC